MRDFIAPVIATVWGGAIIVYAISHGSSPDGSAYSTGQWIAAAFGLALLVAGLTSLRKLRAQRGSPDAG